MPRPSLEEIFGGAGQQNQRPSLDQIFSQEPQQQEYYQPPQQEQRPSLNQIFGQQQPEQSGSGFYDVVSGVADVITKPAVAALETLSYLDKPRGAISGAVKALQNDTPILEGLQQGWKDNTSWKETFNQDWVKENPTTAAIAGFATDVALDPLWFLTPAKVAGGAAKASKAIGLTDNVINPAVRAVNASETGQKSIAALEDFFGKNRVADDIAEFNAGRATDHLAQRDITQFAKDELGQYGAGADKQLINYIESANKNIVNPSEEIAPLFDALGKAKPLTADEAKTLEVYKNALKQSRSDADLTIDEQIKFYEDFFRPNGRTIKEVEALQQNKKAARGAIKPIKEMVDDGSIYQKIKDGEISREQVFDSLRDYGVKIPDTLLDVRQAESRANGVKDAMLPAYQYRDEILSSIPNDGLRKAIQSVGDKFIDLNTKQSEALYRTGRLGDAAAVHFPDGSHLRRSFEKYDNPADFLEDLRKNGTQEEYARAYKDLSSLNAPNPGAQGFGQAHRVAMKDFAERQNLSTDTLKKMGVIENAEYRITDTLNRSSKTLREDQFLSKIASDWGVDAERAAELSRNLPERRRYLQVPEGKGYGALAGQWVPRDVYKQVLNVTGTNTPAEGIQKTMQTLTSWWKVGKLANPSSVMRNFYSGLPMANVFGEVPMQSLPKYMNEMKTIFTKQKWNDPRIRELMQTGIMDNIFTKQELKNILGGKPNLVKNAADKAMSAFGAPDQYWRGVVYAYHRDHGKTAKEAARIADRALFNYGQAPEWINSLSRNGIIPFAKFPYFATKETARAVYNRPAQVTKYLKPQNQTNSDDQDKILPEYMRSKTLLPIGDGDRMVNGKPQKVQDNIDLSYILPFANDVSLGNPLSDLVQVIRTGKNSLGMDIIKPGMTNEQKTDALAKLVYNMLGPSAPVPGTYAWDKLINGITGGVDAKGRQYTPGNAVLDVFGGIRNVPLNVDELYRQKVGSFEREKRDISARINEALRDQRYTPEQRKKVIEEHRKQLVKLNKDAQESRKAYERQRGQ